MVNKVVVKLKRIINLLLNRNSVDKLKTNYKFYSKDIFADKKHQIGDFTYGAPRILFENEDAILKIGKYCSIAEQVTIFLGGNHRTDWVTTYPFNRVPDPYFEDFKTLEGHPATKGNVEIGNDVWIGYKAIVLSGVKIGNGAVVAAGSVVTKNIGAYEIWAGNPAKFIKKRFTDDEIESLEKIKWWDWDQEIINTNINNLCSNSISQFIEKFDPDKK